MCRNYFGVRCLNIFFDEGEENIIDCSRAFCGWNPTCTRYRVGDGKRTDGISISGR